MRKLLGSGGLAPPVYRDACEIARKCRPELPVVCFSPHQLSDTANAFVANFPGDVAYAVKANCSQDVISTIGEAGVKVFDVASCDEMAIVRRVCPGVRLHYHNPVKSRAEIATAFDQYACRRFAADCGAEICKIAEVVGDTRNTGIAVRFRLPAHGQSAHDFSTKFGATPQEAVALLGLASDMGFGCVLTFHPGSQCCDPAAWRRYIASAADIVRGAGVQLNVLNVGGGFPARYGRGDVPALPEIFDEIDKSSAEAFSGMAVPRLECEPGRGMVATSQSVLTRVKLAKLERGEVFLNDGIYGALMEVTQTPEIMPPHRAIRVNGEFCSEMTDWIVYGPTCDPLDTLPVKIALPRDITEDDYIEFGTIGAYGTATATNFNGYGRFNKASVAKVLTA